MSNDPTGTWVILRHGRVMSRRAYLEQLQADIPQPMFGREEYDPHGDLSHRVAALAEQLAGVRDQLDRRLFFDRRLDALAEQVARHATELAALKAAKPSGRRPPRKARDGKIHIDRLGDVP